MRHPGLLLVALKLPDRILRGADNQGSLEKREPGSAAHLSRRRDNRRREYSLAPRQVGGLLKLAIIRVHHVVEMRLGVIPRLFSTLGHIHCPEDRKSVV